MKNLNMDSNRRDEILNLKKANFFGGLESFKKLDLTRLELLISENFINLDERQNMSPSTKDFLNFLKKYPQVKCHGYAIHPRREDYRICIEGLNVTENITDELIEDFQVLCETADELNLSKSELYSWWD